jgi:hypothetical protein
MKTTKMLAVLVLALSLTAKVANADFTFGKPQNLGTLVNTQFDDGTPGISADGLEMYFNSTRPGGLGQEDLWVRTRETVADPWGPHLNLTTVNSPYREVYPSVSPDGLTLYFSDYFYGPDRPGGQGGHDLWMSTRASRSDTWTTPVNMGAPPNSSGNEVSPTVSEDGLTLIFASSRGGGSGYYDLWMSTRPSMQQDWGLAVNLGPVVNSSSGEWECCLSCDGLALFFMSADRAGGLGANDAWVTVRRSINDPWGPPVNLGPPVNTSAEDGNVVISADGRMLYFASRRLGGVGGWDIWQAPILPIVDLNGDGIVDAADMCVVVDHWDTDEPLCDIGPMPWGDGIVDVQDLIVLAEHLFEEVNDLTLVAYWALDEIEGDIASDSANDNDGTVYGDPAWQPEGGMVDGALQLDGIDDYVNTPFVLNPADGKFSVFVWIKGGAPGQAVLSQAGGANWLLADASDGKLMTELVPPAGRLAPQPLVSEFVITDGNWHRIGFAWDGSHRTLYVDDVAVAEDTQVNLAASENGLYIGAGTAMEPGSFFSGLIDDVRIYNRVVSP